MNDSPVDPFAVLETEVAKQAAEVEAAKRLATTRAKLILGRDAKSAFFATLALRLKLVANASLADRVDPRRRCCFFANQRIA